MLGPDVAVPKAPGLDLGVHHGLTSGLREALEHGLSSPEAEPAPGVLLVNGLLADPQLGGDLLPRPPESTGIVHLKRLELLEQPAERRHCAQPHPGVLATMPVDSGGRGRRSPPSW